MTNEQIIGLAKQAGQTRSTPDNCGIYVWSATPASLQRFAELVRNAAFEEAANACETLYSGMRFQPTKGECAEQIRSLKS